NYLVRLLCPKILEAYAHSGLAHFHNVGEINLDRAIYLLQFEGPRCCVADRIASLEFEISESGLYRPSVDPIMFCFDLLWLCLHFSFLLHPVVILIILRFVSLHSAYRMGVGEFPCAVEDLFSRTIKAHGVVPAGHDRQIVISALRIATELDVDR